MKKYSKTLLHALDVMQNQHKMDRNKLFAELQSVSAPRKPKVEKKNKLASALERLDALEGSLTKEQADSLVILTNELREIMKGRGKARLSPVSQDGLRLLEDLEERARRASVRH